MRACNFFCAFIIAFASSVIAVPAVVRIPTAINQAAANPEQGLTITNELSLSESTLRGNEQRIPIPNTDTVLYIAPGSQVQLIPLRILLSRVQLDLIFLIRQHGPEGIPYTTGVRSPRYYFQTRTPTGQGCYFYVNAYKESKLTYGMANETVAGLRMFMLEQRHMSNVVFRVGTHRTFLAIGALSIGLTGPSMTNVTTALTAEPNADIDLRCTWGDDLSSEAIKEALDEARDKLRVVIFAEGRDGQLPGAAGEWSTEGKEGKQEAKFGIVGIPPAHLTWGNMQDAVHKFADLSFNGVNAKEATCQVLLGTDTIGTLSVTKG